MFYDIKPYTVCFFGHRNIYGNIEEIENSLEEMILSLLSEKAYVEFLVGRNGDFDRIVSSVIFRCKRKYRDDNSAHILVLPYLTAEYRAEEKNFEKYYDEIEIAPQGTKSHFKAAFQIRNREMTDRSDLAVFYVKRDSGGAYQTLKYALGHKKEIIEIAALEHESDNERCGISTLCRLLVSNGYMFDETARRRLNGYKYSGNTIMQLQNDKFIITTEINIKGVYNTLVIFPDGHSEVKLDFENPLL